MLRLSRSKLLFIFGVVSMVVSVGLIGGFIRSISDPFYMAVVRFGFVLLTVSVTSLAYYYSRQPITK